MTPVTMKNNLKNNLIALVLNDDKKIFCSKKGCITCKMHPIKQMKNIGNKRMATRTPDQV